ncbi:hypothetical protein OAF54_00085 [bacterium]|nr:hypothetical protein [bacterium]
MKRPSDPDKQGRTQEEQDLLEAYAFGEAVKKRKGGDPTPTRKLMKRIKKKKGSHFLFGTDRKIDRGD